MSTLDASARLAVVFEDKVSLLVYRTNKRTAVLFLFTDTCIHTHNCLYCLYSLYQPQRDSRFYDSIICIWPALTPSSKQCYKQITVFSAGARVLRNSRPQLCKIGCANKPARVDWSSLLRIFVYVLHNELIKLSYSAEQPVHAQCFYYACNTKPATPGPVGSVGARGSKHNHSNQHTIYKQLEGTMRFRNFRTGSAPLSARSKHFFNPPAKINLNFFRKPLSHRHRRRQCRCRRRRCRHRQAAAAIQPNKPQTISLSLSPVRPFTAHSHSRTKCVFAV